MEGVASKILARMPWPLIATVLALNSKCFGICQLGIEAPQVFNKAMVRTVEEAVERASKAP